MSSDIRLAFAHPEERAAATAGRDPMDRISLRDHVVDVEIGAFQTERGTTQRVCFNIVVEVGQQVAPLDDDVDRILSYDAITQAIQIELAAERMNLLETLAGRIAERVLLEPQARRVFVRIEKLDRGPGALGVEIVRTKEQVAPHLAELSEVAADDIPHPIVVYLSNAAVHSPQLSDWLDQLQAAERPVILCVGPAAHAAPQSKAPAAQRRIDLLACEQNAWVLAGQDSRCVVIQTRTELDWAARHGQISVWAPSKIVLDAVDTPPADPGAPLELALWFAQTIAASRVIAIGCDATRDGDPEIDWIALGQRVPV